MRIQTQTRLLMMTAMFSALILLATSVLKIQTPTFGYIHLGETFVLLAGLLLGPLHGALAAGIGSALSDLLGGYLLFVPGTFAIKAATAAVTALCFAAIRKHFFRAQPARSSIAAPISAVPGELIMVVGYFFYNIFVVSVSNGGRTLSAAFSVAVSGLPFNFVQAGAGIVLAALLYPILSRIRLFSYPASTRRAKG